jgi:cell division protein FtsL
VGGTGSSATRRAGAVDPLAVRLLRRARLLADSRLLDRLVRGQLWIPLVAVGLMGIVFMQVSMLKLNAGIGRAVQSASTLERQNGNLRSEVSRMESGDRIATVARGLGMVAPADGGERYVAAGGDAVAASAAQRMTAPDPQALARAQAATATAAAANAPATTATTAATGATTTAAPTATTTPAATTPPPAATQTAAAQAPAAPAVQQTPAAAPQQQQQTASAPPSATPSPPASATTATATAGGAAAPTGN